MVIVSWERWPYPIYHSDGELYLQENLYNVFYIFPFQITATYFSILSHIYCNLVYVCYMYSDFPSSMVCILYVFSVPCYHVRFRFHILDTSLYFSAIQRFPQMAVPCMSQLSLQSLIKAWETHCSLDTNSANLYDVSTHI